MKAIVLLVAFLASCLATSCPANPAFGGGTGAQSILVSYKYSYSVPKNGAQLHLNFAIDDAVLRANQTFWMRVTSDATTAHDATLNVKINVNQESQSTDPNCFSGDLATGSAEETKANLNFTTNGDLVWLDFYPSDCSLCKSTIDFSVETAWLLDNSPRVWAPVVLVDDVRTIVFDEAQGGYVNFFAAALQVNDSLWTSVVFPGDADQKSEVDLYWNQGAPATIANSVDHYPQDGTLEGNYVTSRPFVATTAGTWFIGAYVKTQAVSIENPAFTLKVGFNKVPCSDASSVMASSFLLVLLMALNMM